MHFTEDGDGDGSGEDDSDSGSDGDGDGRIPGEPRRETVPGTDWPRRPNDAWERPNEPMPAVYPDNETYDKELSSKPIWERSVAPACGDVTTIDGSPLTLVAAGANAGDEIFNTFGDHGNALLLHKYGFCEWDNAHGGVTISHETLFKVLGPEVVVEVRRRWTATPRWTPRRKPSNRTRASASAPRSSCGSAPTTPRVRAPP